MKILLTHSVLIVLVSQLSACASSPEVLKYEPSQEVLDEYLVGKQSKLKGMYRSVLEEGDRNRVLNNLRIGIAELQLKNIPAAKRLFDEAIIEIEALYADDPAAKKARSRYSGEAIKNYKGEGYERVMAFYYMGLIYLIESDYENAAATFRSASLQDSMAEADEYTVDFASMDWLAGWATQCLEHEGNYGYDKQKEFDGAARIRSELEQPNDSDNFLLIAELGSSPVKIASGEHKENLTYKPGEKSSIEYFIVNDSAYKAIQAEDIYFQSSTRGGRLVDMINAGKASFKDSTASASETAGNVASGTLMATNIGMQTHIASGNFDQASQFGTIGLGLSLAASIFSGVSGSMSKNAIAHADIRYWDNLSDKLYFGTATLKDVSYVTNIETSNPDVGRYTTYFSDGVCGLALVRSHSALDVPDSHVNAFTGVNNEK